MLKLKFATAVFVLMFAAGGVWMLHAAVGAFTEIQTTFTPLTQPATLQSPQQHQVQP